MIMDGQLKSLNKVELEMTVNIICAAMNISVDRIVGDKRDRFVVNRRMVLVYHLILTFGFSYYKVSKWMKRHHSSIMYLKRQYEVYILIYDDLQKLNLRVENVLNIESYNSKI